MAKADTNGFNADERAKVRAERNIIIGGLTFKPRKRSMQMMREWNAVVPSGDEVTAEDRDPMENFADVYRQVRVFLQDDEGGQPEVEFLEAELDVEDAIDLLMDLQPVLNGNAERVRDSSGEAVSTAT